MAVSMNAGSMRSDYMISDAALPMRMEELEQLEQTAKFSEILGEIGNVSKHETISTEETVTSGEQTVVVTEVSVQDNAESSGAEPGFSMDDLQALAEAVVRGEVKLDELPQECVTDVLLAVIAMMMLGATEDDMTALQKYAEGDVKPVQLDVKAAQAFVEAVKQQESTKLNPDIVNDIMEQLDIPQQTKQLITKQVEKAAYAENRLAAQMAADAAITEVKAEPETADAEITAVVEAAATQAVEQTAEAYQQPNSGAQQGNAQADMAQTAAKTAHTAGANEQDKLDEEFQQLKKVITEYTVKKSEPQREQPVQQTNVAETTAKGRMVSKSDELMMLKNAAKPTAEADTSAQTAVMPQDIAPQNSVVFARADGTEVAVKAEEIIRQVADNIIQQAATTADGETEYSLTLNPEDLGSITVKLTKAVDGALTVSIMADNAKTQRLIEQNGAAIQQSLRNDGIELENWQTVNQSQQKNSAEDYNGSSKNPYFNNAEEQSEGDGEEDNTFAELISAM